MANEGNTLAKGFPGGNGQWLAPLQLLNASGSVVFSVDSNGSLTLAGATLGGGVETGLTAHVGGTQAAALALSATKLLHVVTTVGSAADSVALPLATGSGARHIVSNQAAANSLQIFGSGTDTIDAVATATGVALAAGKGAEFCDYAAGKWFRVNGA